MLNQSINLNSSGKGSSNRHGVDAKMSGAALTKQSQIEETKSEGFIEGEEVHDDEELKQMSKSTVWTQNIYTNS